MSMRRSNGQITPASGASTDVTLNREDFSGAVSAWTWNTPGLDDPRTAWFAIVGATPSGSTGPDGGANPTTRAVDATNAYAYTEATDNNGPWSLESPTFDASRGTLTLTFDVHMKFGSVGGITEGTLQVQGWDGQRFRDIGAAIVGSQQTTADAPYRSSADFDAYTSTGFANPDFKFRFLMSKGLASASNADTAIDNCLVTGPAGAVTEQPIDARTAAFDTGLRKIFVNKQGNNGNDGLSEGGAKLTLQAGFNILRAGDVLIIGAGRYRETLSLTNIPGTPANPVWIAAEVPGEVIVDNLVQSAFNGTASWRSDGGGVFSIPGSRPYIGWEVASGDLLPGFRAVRDITAATIPTTRGPNNPSGSIRKPSRGVGFAGGRISIRCRNGANPNGRSIALTNGFVTTQLAINNADNVIVDGLVFEGAGDGAAIALQPNCANPTIRNCVFTGCQFGVRCVDDTLIESCEYTLVGLSAWQRELAETNGPTINAVFKYAKNYYTASLVGGSDNDALLEGGLDVSIFGRTANDVRITNCYVHSVFEGSKAGRHRNVEVDNCVFDECLDDAIELETASGGQGVRGRADVHDCRIRNCFSSMSHQGDVVHEDHFVYRNVIEITDPDIVHPPFLIKSIKTPGTVDIHYYHNLMINPSDVGNDGFGDSHTVWFAFSGPNGDADKIVDWRNNIVIFENDLDNTQTNPRASGRRNNVVVSPANNAQSRVVQGTNGVFAGTRAAAMNLGPNQQLLAGSPAIGAGAPLPDGLPDSFGDPGVNADAGPFPNGFDPGPDWPRPARRVFSKEQPSRWTNPGV